MALNEKITNQAPRGRGIGRALANPKQWGTKGSTLVSSYSMYSRDRVFHRNESMVEPFGCERGKSDLSKYLSLERRHDPIIAGLGVTRGYYRITPLEMKKRGRQVFDDCYIKGLAMFASTIVHIKEVVMMFTVMDKSPGNEDPPYQIQFGFDLVDVTKSMYPVVPWSLMDQEVFDMDKPLEDDTMIMCKVQDFTQCGKEAVRHCLKLVWRL